MEHLRRRDKSPMRWPDRSWRFRGPTTATVLFAAVWACGSCRQSTQSPSDAAADAPGPPPLALPLHTASRFIVDANNQRFKLAGVNWYGGESPDLVPLGLDHADVNAIAHLIRQLGFNSV